MVSEAMPTLLHDAELIIWLYNFILVELFLYVCEILGVHRVRITMLLFLVCLQNVLPITNKITSVTGEGCISMNT